MKTTTNHFISIVVICYNGSGTIARSLESLLNLNYPRSKYEIIVVDDGSTDNTAEVVRRFPEVRYVPLPYNQGISAARNAGLKAAKGDIYIAFDDDCIADRDWLKHLMKGYNLDKPAGVGGYMIDDGKDKGIAKRYLHAKGSGPAPVASSKPPKTLLGRLKNYLIAGKEQNLTVQPYVKVHELYGANGSYPLHVLKKIGGWRKEMSGIEDRDLSLRIHKAFPDHSFYAMRDAKISHDPALSLKQYLLRPYRRGTVNFNFHRQNNIIPPIFPFPFAFLLGVLITVPIDLRLTPIAIIIIPQLLYFWWPVKFLKKHHPADLLFPYIQLAEETMVIIGLLRGLRISGTRK